MKNKILIISVIITVVFGTIAISIINNKRQEELAMKAQEELREAYRTQNVFFQDY